MHQVLFSLRGRWPQILGIVAFSALGCQPKVGDECATSTDCSASGDRFCDKTQPSGYCTVFNCEPGSCPEESICVAFGAELSTAPLCQTSTGTSPYQRTFCLATCESNDDCRSKYECTDMRAANNPWGAVVVENGGSGKVCAVPFSGSPIPENRPHDICSPNGEPRKVVPFSPTAAGGAGGNAGAAGNAGEAGQAGAAGTSGAAGLGGSAGESGSAGAGGANAGSGGA